MKKIISVLVILLLCACSSNNYKTIDATDAYEMIKNENDVVILDVRNRDEFMESHILNSINIPLAEIEQITLDKDSKIIVYCLSGVRSLEASKKLVSMGYTSVYNIDGGLINWGYELVSE